MNTDPASPTFQLYIILLFQKGGKSQQKYRFVLPVFNLGRNGHSHKNFIGQGGWREGQIEKINGDVTNNLGNTFTTYFSLLANLHYLNTVWPEAKFFFGLDIFSTR